MIDNKQLKVMTVDDSAFIRNALSSMIGSDSELKVIGTARDGVEAIDKALSLKPDLITLDVDMPKMDGIETLKVLMDKNPIPVIMVSSLTTEGAKITLDALDIGAVDFIPKNLSDLSVNILKIKEILVSKIKQICRSKKKLGNNNKKVRIHPKKEIKFTSLKRINVVTIGTSTGGPKALQSILPMLPKDLPVPVLVAQHMPPSFTGPFAERLNNLSQIRIKEAEEGEKVLPGVAYIAPGSGHMSVVGKTTVNNFIKIAGNGNEFTYKPSVDCLMLSLANLYQRKCLGIILTGMGNDGLNGMKAIKESGGMTIAQDEDTCVIYGMPKAVVDERLADKVVPISEIAGEIISLV